MAYMLFAFNNYYPYGGMNDHQATFPDMDTFYAYTIDTDYDTYQIFDTYNGNKSTLDLYRKIQEIEDVEPILWSEEGKLRLKYIEDFVSDFINRE